MRNDLAAIGRALAVLAVGFALAETGPGRALGDAVAAGLALLAAPILTLMEPGTLRSGTELRGAAGWAVRVTEVCDGHGLVISLAAGLAALAPGLGQGLRRLAWGIVAIQAFNLVRIIALALVLARSPAAFDAVHGLLFPLLTVGLISVCILPLRRAGPFLVLSLVLVPLWLAAAPLAAQGLVPLVNLILPAVGPEFGELAERAAGWTLGTNLLAAQEGDQIRRFLVPLAPEDFALATPMILAGVILARRPLWIVPAVLSMAAALALGGMTAVWALAAAQAPATLLQPVVGGLAAVPYAPPEAGHATAALAQNVLIHLNLLILPLFLATLGRRHA